MGLDMYLTKKTFIWSDWTNEGKRDLSKITLPEKYKDIKPERINNISEEVAYWRKANHIHKWFVDNVQKGKDDCESYYVDKEQLQELVTLCQKVLDKELIPEDNLPCQSGFFFGGTDYDEYYFQTLENTIKQLTPLLEEEGDFYYSSSW